MRCGVEGSHGAMQLNREREFGAEGTRRPEPGAFVPQGLTGTLPSCQTLLEAPRTPLGTRKCPCSPRGWRPRHRPPGEQRCPCLLAPGATAGLRVRGQIIWPACPPPPGSQVEPWTPAGTNSEPEAAEGWSAGLAHMGTPRGLGSFPPWAVPSPASPSWRPFACPWHQIQRHPLSYLQTKNIVFQWKEHLLETNKQPPTPHF